MACVAVATGAGGRPGWSRPGQAGCGQVAPCGPEQEGAEMPQELEEGAGWDLLPPGLSRGQTRPAPFPRRGAPRPGRRGRRRGAADSGGGPCAASRMGEGVHLYRHRFARETARGSGGWNVCLATERPGELGRTGSPRDLRPVPGGEDMAMWQAQTEHPAAPRRDRQTLRACRSPETQPELALREGGREGGRSLA